MKSFEDALKIDNHKLMYHVDRVNQWLKGKDIYPIYVEIGPSGSCNHRCSFCALDYLNYQPQFIDTKAFKATLFQMSACGVKSVMFAGEGEPFLHPDIAELILYAEKKGLDVATTTNGVLFNEGIAKECLGALSWMRVSINAGTPSSYAKIHHCLPGDFNKVLRNIAYAVGLKNKHRYLCTIGAQSLLLPENYQEIPALAKKLKDIGVDYFIIKPYSQHPKSKKNNKRIFNRQDYALLIKQLQELSGGNFKIIFRANTFEKMREEKPYNKCLGLPFWAYIDSGGNAYACSTFLGDEAFCYGNIYKHSFKEIWKGPIRKKILNRLTKGLDGARCRKACRLDAINRYLWDLKYPHPHVNFI